MKQNKKTKFKIVCEDNKPLLEVPLYIFVYVAQKGFSSALITIIPFRSPLPKMLYIFKGGSAQNPDASGAYGGLFENLT